MPQEKRVLIVGAGIGGLSAAYYLSAANPGQGQFTYRCTVVERENRPGGNVYSAYFSKAYEGEFADLGVNDFNWAEYPLMVDLLNRLAADKYPVPTAPLWDEACFFTAPDDKTQDPVCYTSEDMRDGKEEDLQAQRKKFDGMVEEVLTNPEYDGVSVGKFLTDRGFSNEFRNHHVLPRINAMYYMNRGAPDKMPIRAVMMYYRFQEGAGRKPDRRYFVRGASQWIDQLCAALTRKYGVSIHLNSKTEVVGYGPSGVQVKSDSAGVSGNYDYVILAVPANRIREVIPGVTDEITRVTDRFEYIDSDACAHTDPRVLPPDRNRWETYNVLIPATNEKRLYTISYVENMHQGAPKPPVGAWFVSENRMKDVDGRLIKHMVDLADPTGPMRPATITFPHNTLTPDSLRAQRELCQLQGKWGLYYTGGWTNGAGLHEEVLAVSLDISYMIRGINFPLNGPCGPGRHPVPGYIRRSFSKEPMKLYPDGFWE